MRAPLILILITATAAVLVLLVLLFRGNEIATSSAPGGEDLVGHSAAGEAAPAPVVHDPETATPAVLPEEIPAGVRTAESIIADDRFTRLEDGRSISNEGYAAARALHRPEAPPQEDLEQLEAVFGLYLWAYHVVPEGGENYELMQALKGDNPHRVIFFPPDGRRFDAEGNLLDRWGMPYFMHKISDQLVDIVSSGPDKRLWTDDDLSLGLTDDYDNASID